MKMNISFLTPCIWAIGNLAIGHLAIELLAIVLLAIKSIATLLPKV